MSTGMCRTWLTAVLQTASAETRAAYKGCAVLGDSSHYTVELASGEQIEVGRTCCKYCARAEAVSTLSARAVFTTDQIGEVAQALAGVRPSEHAAGYPAACEREGWRKAVNTVANVMCRGQGADVDRLNAQRFFALCGGNNETPTKKRS